MPLWFVFLNAAIATDLLLSQLLRISVIKLQAIHKWYLPVASLTAFTLALPLLLYHSAYQPTANVFSVQFPSVLSVTLYYILAFDLWLAVGILYCFIVVSIVVSVILIKLRQKRAAWVRQNMSQMESGWTTHPEATPKNELNQEPVENSDSDQNNAFTAVASEAETSPTSTGSSTDGNQTTLPSGNIYIIDNSRGSCTDGFQLDTLASGQIQSSSNKELLPAHAVAASSTTNPSDTLMSGMTFTEFHESLNHGDNNAFEAIAERSLPAHQKSVLFVEQQDKSSSSSGSSCPSRAQCMVIESLASDPAQHSAGLESSKERQVIYTSGATAVEYIEVKQAIHVLDSPSIAPEIIQISGGEIAAVAENSQAQGAGLPKDEPATRARRPLLTLESLPPQFTLRSSNQSTFVSQSHGAPFRIPTLALVRLLLYPLIPIFSFTLMCVVRWVWFRSAMPSRWEILNVVSGFLRAMEGFLCLFVFLLNPALNRSFREIRKRNTPVFT